MIKSVPIALASVSALSFFLSVAFVQLLFGIGSDWGMFFTISDYFDLSVALLPKIMVLLLSGLLIGLIGRPAYQPNETREEYDARTGHSDYWRAKENRDRWLIQLMAAITVPIAPPELVPLAVFILAATLSDRAFDLLEFALGERFYKLFNGDTWLKLTSTYAVLAATAFVWAEVVDLRVTMASFDEEGACGTVLCVDNRMLVSSIRAGRIVYADGQMELLAENGDALARSGYSPASRRSLLCGHTPVCSWLSDIRLSWRENADTSDETSNIGDATGDVEETTLPDVGG